MHEKTKEIIQCRVKELTGWINRNLKWIEEDNQRTKSLQEENNKFEEEVRQLLMNLNEGGTK